jgi:hypothetical protein
VNRSFTMLYLGVLVLAGCASNNPRNEHNPFAEANIRSVLVVPVVNHSLDVDAANYMLSTLTIPLAEKGYYVFPVNTVKVLLEQEGFYEPDIIHSQDSAALARMFDADAILYVRINRWDAQYAVLSTVVTVDFDYRIVTREGQQIWQTNKQLRYQPSNNNSTGNPLANLIGAAIQAAITKAAPNYMPLTEQANDSAVSSIPPGPYLRAKKAE